MEATKEEVVEGFDFTVDQMRAAFDMIADKQNWKLPLHGIISKEEFRLCDQAAIFFAGSPLESKDIGGGKLEVAGFGYYVCIGA